MTLTDSDLAWQAFAYWSDELSPEERSRFEAQLEDDQQAREALARVVELSHAVIAAESLAPAPVCRAPERRSRRVAAWTAGLAASALALLLGFALGQRPEWPSLPAANRPIDPALASAWTDIRSNWSELVVSQQVVALESSADSATDEVESLEQQTGSDWDSTSLEAPSWMTAAVLGQAAEGEAANGELPATESLPGASSKES